VLYITINPLRQSPEGVEFDSDADCFVAVPVTAVDREIAGIFEKFLGGS